MDWNLFISILLLVLIFFLLIWYFDIREISKKGKNEINNLSKVLEGEIGNFIHITYMPGIYRGDNIKLISVEEDWITVQGVNRGEKRPESL